MAQVTIKEPVRTVALQVCLTYFSAALFLRPAQVFFLRQLKEVSRALGVADYESFVSFTTDLCEK